jgi:hypothetical protein
MAKQAIEATRATFAEFEKVLWYTDGPQLVLLRVKGGSFVIGVSICRVSVGAEFFGSRISPDLLESYLRNRCDLRFVLSNPDRRTHYTFDLPKEGRIQLTKLNFQIKKHERYLPDHRLFASDHTEDYVLDGGKFSFSQRYFVDGKWEVAEFSKFNRNLSDLYALGRSLENFEHGEIDQAQRQKIIESFIQPWRGGGSYVSFFKEIGRAGGRQSRPVVDAIQWASPGHMDFLGDQSSFKRLSVLIRHYDAHREQINAGYDRLRGYLSERKLLRPASRRVTSSAVQIDAVNDMAKRFSKELGLTSYRTIKKLSGNDPVVASKVLLASARRLENTHRFFLEGRIALEGYVIG